MSPSAPFPLLDVQFSRLEILDGGHAPIRIDEKNRLVTFVFNGLRQIFERLFALFLINVAPGFTDHTKYLVNSWNIGGARGTVKSRTYAIR